MSSMNLQDEAPLGRHPLRLNPTLRFKGLHLLLLALFGGTGCGGDPGRVEVRLTWGPGGVPTEDEATLFGRIVEGELDPSGDLIVGPALVGQPAIAEATPTPVAASARLRFEAVPHGDRRVVIVEVRGSRDRAATLLRYGISAPFTLEPGRASTVGVVLDLITPPGGLAELAIGTASVAAVVRSPLVELRLETDTGVRAVVSNFEGFPVGSDEDPLSEVFPLDTPVNLGCRATPGTDRPCAFVVSWNLNRGLLNDCGVDEARGFSREDRCPRQVFVVFEDAAGQRSALVSQTVVLDTRAPELLSTGTGVEPAVARAESSVEVRLGFSEPVLPGSVDLRIEGVTAAFERILPPPGEAAPTADYRYRLPRARDLGSARTFDLVVSARDRPGNALSLARVGTLVVDDRAPTIEELEILEPTASAESPLARAREGSVVEVRFRINGDDLAADGLDVRLGVLAMDCGPGPFGRGESVTCRTPPLAAPTPLFTRSEQVTVRAVDAAGNIGEASVALVLDFEGPQIQAASVEYTPGPATPLARVEAAQVGARVTFVLTFNEPVRRPPPALNLRLSQADGWSETLSLTLVEGSTTSAGARYAASVPAGLRSGDYVDEAGSTPCPGAVCGRLGARLELTDVVGNLAVVTRAPGAILRIRAEAPTLEVSQDRVSYIRSPVGMAQTEDLGAYALPAGPYFGLAPADALTRTSTLAVDAFRLATGEPAYAIRVWADPLKDGLLTTVIRPRPDGAWERADLDFFSPDVPAVYVSGFDRAGNESDAVRVENAWFVGTSATPGRGRSPHDLTTAGLPQRPLVPGASIERPGALDGPDTRVELRRAALPWEVVQRRGAFNAPGRLDYLYLAFDSARGLPVFRTSRIEGWDGATWQTLSAFDDEPVVTGPIAYDSGRGRTVLFGENGETWEWDGREWVERTPTSGSPPPREGAALAYDSARRRVVLFGGATATELLDDTWTWDGAAWTPVTATIAPSARFVHGMAFDPAHGEIVLFGGLGAQGRLGDTWTWDGRAWRRAGALGTSPPARLGHGMTFAPREGWIVLHGGDSRGDTWTWDGSAWTEVTSPGPRPPPDIRVALTSNKDGHVLFAGDDATWLWDGATWSDRTPETPFILHRESIVAYDEARRRLVLVGPSFFGGMETWELEGRVWRNVTPPAGNPPERMQHELVYDSRSQRILMFGGGPVETLGYIPTFQDLWAWDGAAWTELVPSTPDRPGPRYAHAMAYDRARGELLVFGGDDGLPGSSAQIRGDMWAWDGTRWRERVFTNGPEARAGHVLAYDEARQRVVLFGGESRQARLLDDTWAWDGASWSRLSPARHPAARAFATMAYDPGARRLILFGGLEGSPPNSFFLAYDTWVFDGTTWDIVSEASERPDVVNSTLFHDRVDGRTFLADGSAGLWGLGRPSIPSAQIDVALPADLTREQLTGIRVRAFCGGRYAPYAPVDTGAQLLGWVTGGPGNPPGAWTVLATNTASVTLALPSQGLIDFVPVAASAEAVAQSFYGPDHRMYFQCRPDGESGTGRAEVALDYIEARIRYRTR